MYTITYVDIILYNNTMYTFLLIQLFKTTDNQIENLRKKFYFMQIEKIS